MHTEGCSECTIEGCSGCSKDSIECILKVVASVSYSLPLSSYRLCILRIV